MNLFDDIIIGNINYYDKLIVLQVPCKSVVVYCHIRP